MTTMQKGLLRATNSPLSSRVSDTCAIRARCAEGKSSYYTANKMKVVLAQCKHETYSITVDDDSPGRCLER